MAQKRASDLEILIRNIYEDSILGKLPEARYSALDEQYAKEQGELSEEIEGLEAAINGYEKSRKSADRFIALVEEYENFDTLTNVMLNEVVEKILVHERDHKRSIETTQRVKILFSFVGRHVLPRIGEMELSPEQQEEIRKRKERKNRLHQNCLKCKANTKQKKHGNRTRAKKS